jgi:hypothetical protein
MSLEATGFCINIGNSEIVIAAVHKSQGRVWIDADITEILNLRSKCVLTGCLSAKHPFWESRYLNP